MCVHLCRTAGVIGEMRAEAQSSVQHYNLWMKLMQRWVGAVGGQGTGVRTQGEKGWCKQLGGYAWWTGGTEGLRRHVRGGRRRRGPSGHGLIRHVCPAPLAAPPADFKNVSIVGHYIKERTAGAQVRWLQRRGRPAPGRPQQSQNCPHTTCPHGLLRAFVSESNGASTHVFPCASRKFPHPPSPFPHLALRSACNICWLSNVAALWTYLTPRPPRSSSSSRCAITCLSWRSVWWASTRRTTQPRPWPSTRDSSRCGTSSRGSRARRGKGRARSSRGRRSRRAPRRARRLCRPWREAACCWVAGVRGREWEWEWIGKPPLAVRGDYPSPSLAIWDGMRLGCGVGDASDTGATRFKVRRGPGHSRQSICLRCRCSCHDARHLWVM